MRIVLLTLLAAFSALAQGTRPKLPNEQWVQIFNGKDFTGWVKVGNEQWTVEDGTFHTDFKAGTADVSKGLQFEIDQLIGHTGGIYGDGRQWIVWPAPEFEMVLRHNDWNDYLLIVEGNRYVARLNGVVVVDFTDPTPKSFDGAIALQLHSGGKGNMRFKDIYIRDLTRR
jgi:hypothetical protein